MKNYMIDHAIRNVWCSPFQDDQAILQLCRITTINRAVNFFEYQNRRVALPTQKEDYHVYVIGGNSQTRLNLVEGVGKWVTLSELAGTSNLFSDVYIANGLQFPKHSTYVMRGLDMSYMIAIPTGSIPVNFDYEKVYLRLYRNSYFGSDHDESEGYAVQMGGGVVIDTTHALSIQREFINASNRPVGHAYAIVNGYMVDNFLPNEVTRGDSIEWIHDASIAEVVDLKITDLEIFHSTLDSMTKYIIHPPKNRDGIQYHDDVDIWLVNKDPARPGRWKGIYVNKNDPKSVRMLTHRDYSIPSATIAGLLQLHPGWATQENMYIRLHMRHSGYQRPLVDEHHRIRELYKLSDEGIVRAMAGVDATVPEWQVATLEKSNYTRIMRSYYQNITPEEVMHAYGYNAMAKLIADTPNKVVSGYVDVPLAYRTNSTAFEYDFKGHMTGWRLHPGGDAYYPMKQTTTLVEFVDGIGGLDADFNYSSDDVVVVDPLCEYRYYACRLTHLGLPSNDWVEVTNDRNFYYITPEKEVKWVFDPRMYIGAVKSNKKFTCFDLTIPEHNHLYRFEVIHQDALGQLLMLAPGRVDVWMNGRALIEHIDYHVIYPEIVIFNKEYLVEGAQQFTVRGYGLVDESQTRELSTQRGYVQHGMLSVNNVYDTREDKIIRCVVDGKTFHREALKFSETQRNVKLPDVDDGRPYVIQDVLAPVRGVVDYQTYPLRSQSVAVDKRVSDYLTLKLPEVLPTPPVAIKRHYHIYSPFLARVLFDLWDNNIPSPAANTAEDVIDKFISPYKWLLDFDPCRRDYVDDRFSNIHPHPKQEVLEVTRRQYAFLDRLNRVYLFGRVDLTAFLAIVGEGEDGEIIEPPEIPDPEVPIPPTNYPWYVRPEDQLVVSLPSVTEVMFETIGGKVEEVILSEPWGTFTD